MEAKRKQEEEERKKREDDEKRIQVCAHWTVFLSESTSHEKKLVYPGG